MKKILFTTVFLLAMCLSTAVQSANIVYPWRSTTAIVQSGNSFEVWFNADPGQSVNSTELRGSYHTVTCSHSILEGDWQYDPLSGNRYNTKITVTVPSETPADRYDLVLKTSSHDQVSYGGVKVVRAFKENYYIMHISDGHIFQNGYDANLLLARKSVMIDIANIMDCQMIIETGDNMYNVRNHPEREGYYFLGVDEENIKGMAKASAATFLVPGDHDGHTANDWPQAEVDVNSDFFNDYWGMQNTNFKYGNGRFMMFNNAWDVSTTSGKQHQYQTEDAVAWLDDAGSGGNFFMTAGHCYNKMHEFVNASEPLDLVLAGDKHHIRTNNPYEFYPGSAKVAYIAGSIRDHFEFNLFEVNNTAGTFSTVSGTNGVVEVLASGDQNVRASWEPKLTLVYTNLNDGSAMENRATIVNKYNFPIKGARVRFVMPLESLYNVTKGQIVQSFDGTLVHVVDVSVDLEANSTTEVNIAPSDKVDLCPDDPSKMEPGECGCGVPESVCNPIGVVGVDVLEAAANLYMNTSIQLNASIEPSDATNQSVRWSSSNAAVATVNTNGFVTAMDSGTATITATAEDGGKTAFCEITVIPDFLTLQAEDALFNGPVAVADQDGYNGTGFVDFTNSSDDYITWEVDVESKAAYSLSFRYALLAGNRPLKLTINNEVKIPSLAFPFTGSWSTWGYYRTTQLLNAGKNTVTLTAIGNSGGNFDELAISESQVNTGLGDLKSGADVKSVCIYPNPYSRGKLYVDMVGFENQGQVRLRIYNLMGRSIYQKIFQSSTQIELNLPGRLTESVYFVSVESSDGKVTEKLIVR